jgi:hypothetical protein
MAGLNYLVLLCARLKTLFIPLLAHVEVRTGFFSDGASGMNNDRNHVCITKSC